VNVEIGELAHDGRKIQIYCLPVETAVGCVNGKLGGKEGQRSVTEIENRVNTCDGKRSGVRKKKATTPAKPSS